MDWWLACFFLGAIFSLFLPIVPDLFVLFSLILLSIIFFYYPFSKKRSIKPLRLNSGLLFGASWMLLNAFDFQQLWQENNLNVIDLSSKAQWIQGDILSLHSPLEKAPISLDKTTQPNSKLRFNINITHINNNKLKQAIKLRLSWKKPSLSLQQGQSVSLKVKFKPAHGLANLGSFSYQTWLNSKRISATGYVVNHKNNTVLLNKITLRQKLYRDYKRLLPEHDLSPLLLALAFGSRAQLTPELWQVLQATGTGHLIAISGLHIGLVATGAFVVFMFIIRALPLNSLGIRYRLQTVNNRYVVIVLSLFSALSYGYLAGFSLPTIRALVMLVIYWCIRLLGIKISIKRWLLFTLFIITLITPFSLFTASFWLSFYAVVIIFLTLWRFKNFISSGNPLWRFIKGLLVIQLSLTLMLLPISAIFFQQISWIGLFANIIAVPWMSFISIPLCLLSVLLMPISSTLSQFFITLCLESIQLLWHYLSYLSTIPWAISTLSSFFVLAFVFVGLWCLGAIFFQAKMKPNDRIMLIIFFSAVLLLLGFKLEAQLNKKQNNLQLVVFDVGQGLSILIKRDEHAILYDTGASYKSGFNMAEAIVLPYLQYEGITQLDKVIISHSDNDHAGGLDTLQQSIVIKELIYNVENNNNENEISSRCLQGDSFYWQGIKVEFLWPIESVSQENDDSCVLLLSDKHHKILLTGDISKKVERKLMQRYPNLQADVLVVPHHGSKTSSSERFIAQINPDIAIVSAGYLNRWRMPVADVVKRYQKNNIALLNSAYSGQIILDLSESGITKYTYAEHLWPFWFASSSWY